MARLLKKLLGDNCGASSAEYALILALLGSGIAGAAFTLSQTVSTAMLYIGTLISG